MEKKKKPIGSMPEFIWKEKRIIDLARAIHDYTDVGIIDQITVGKWSVELCKLLKEIYEKE